ncbi:MAG TPA: hypothetical protein VF006_08670 [Longimicrobium sp.]
MMEIKTTLQAPPADADLDPGIREALPPLFVGDRAESTREHEWPGSLFYVLSYVAAVGLAAGGVGCLGYGVFTVDPGLPALGLLLGIGAAVQWRLATEVQYFSRWGWYGAMVELAAAAVAKVWSMAEGNVVGGLVGVCIDVAWMAYFWDRREHFDVDLGG